VLIVDLSLYLKTKKLLSVFPRFMTNMLSFLRTRLPTNDIQITSDYMSRWVVLKRRVGVVTSQRVLKVLFYVNILQCFFVVENFSRPKSVFKDQEAVKRLSSLHDKYVIVPADKASNNIVFVCKSYYFECLIKELGINSNTSSLIVLTQSDKDSNLGSWSTSLFIHLLA
jgi:hypothetical protein